MSLGSSLPASSPLGFGRVEDHADLGPETRFNAVVRELLMASRFFPSPSSHPNDTYYRGTATASPAKKANILLVEDEEGMRMALGDRLHKEGYGVESAIDGDTGFEKAMSAPFDLIILDIMLPGRNGLDLCRDIRAAGVRTPVLLLTARADTVDKIVGLKLGADAYLTKPFDMLELLARIEALLRRPLVLSGTVSHDLGRVRVDMRTRQVTRDGVPVHLVIREFQLLCYFIEHRGTPLSRDQILRDVWGFDVVTFTRTVDVHVVGLRQKLEKDPKSPELILTVTGIGYMLAG
jgi:two-component system, OmpR family, alkaline phosphatase synthesis response regulator PhoP